MRHLRNFSIERKLQCIIMLAVSTALMLAIGAFVAWDLMSARDNMRNDQLTLATIAGSRKTLDYATLQAELDLPTAAALEAVVISSINHGLIQVRTALCPSAAHELVQPS